MQIDDHDEDGNIYDDDDDALAVKLAHCIQGSASWFPKTFKFLQTVNSPAMCMGLDEVNMRNIIKTKHNKVCCIHFVLPHLTSLRTRHYVAPKYNPRQEKLVS